MFGYINVTTVCYKKGIRGGEGRGGATIRNEHLLKQHSNWLSILTDYEFLLMYIFRFYITQDTHWCVYYKYLYPLIKIFVVINNIQNSWEQSKSDRVHTGTFSFVFVLFTVLKGIENNQLITWNNTKTQENVSVCTGPLYLMKLTDVRKNTNEHKILYKQRTWVFI